MIYIENHSLDPAYNLALEEYLLKTRTDMEDIFLLWKDEPTVVVGRNQNTIEEINQQYIEQHGIHVVRRLSGGGAVYHDDGNVNFTFIVRDEHRDTFDFPRFTQPIIAVLKELGIEAQDQGRNDITIDGKKFSGNAQVRYKDRLLHHGTILFNSSMEDMVACLQVGEDKYLSKGVKSVRSRVTNVSEHLLVHMDIQGFRNKLRDRIWLEGSEEATQYHLTNEDLQCIQTLKKDKYDTWAWNYGASPDFDVQRSQRFTWGKIYIRIKVTRGFIQHMAIYGDFFAIGEMNDLAGFFIGIPYEKNALGLSLASIPWRDYLPYMDEAEWLQLFLGA